MIWYYLRRSSRAGEEWVRGRSGQPLRYRDDMTARIFCEGFNARDPLATGHVRVVAVDDEVEILI